MCILLRFHSLLLHNSLKRNELLRCHCKLELLLGDTELFSLSDSLGGLLGMT